jgi:hypothetical protein
MTTIIDILGFPSYNDVEDYMNKYQYDSLYKRSLNHSKVNKLFETLISPKEKKTNLYYFKTELIDIINGCIMYNMKKRLKLEDILKRLEYLNKNIKSEFHSEILNNINITRESGTNNSNANKNIDIKCIKKNIIIESEKFKDINIDNNNNIKLKKKIDNIYQKPNNNRYAYNNNINNMVKKGMEKRKDNVKFIKDSDKKENIMDYFREEKKEKMEDEYKELEESKYIIILIKFKFYRD